MNGNKAAKEKKTEHMMRRKPCVQRLNELRCIAYLINLKKPENYVLFGWRGPWEQTQTLHVLSVYSRITRGVMMP